MGFDRWWSQLALGGSFELGHWSAVWRSRGDYLKDYLHPCRYFSHHGNQADEAFRPSRSSTDVNKKVSYYKQQRYFGAVVLL
jgi:hypothetical protein